MSTDREKVDEVLEMWSKRKSFKERKYRQLVADIELLELEILHLDEMREELDEQFSTPDLQIFTPEENDSAGKFVAESIHDELESIDT